MFQEGARLPGSAAQKRVQPGDEFLDVEGFGEIIVRAEVQPVQPLVERAARGKEDHRHGRMPVPQIAQDAQAVAPGQHDVQHDRVVAPRAGQGETVVPVVAEIHHEALRFEPFPQEGAEFLVVFHDQNLHAFRLEPVMNFAEENDRHGRDDRGICCGWQRVRSAATPVT